MRNRTSILAYGVITFLAVNLLLPGQIEAGSLTPPTSAVDETGNPVSTMKSLDKLPPTWARKIDGPERFELVLDGAAVLDKETGLVWEQSPSTTTMNWAQACTHCYLKEVANRKGWRLPTVEELASLVDNDNSSPVLPTDHPFTNVESVNYWSSSTSADNTSNAWYVSFYNGYMGHAFKTYSGYYVWCVRGGHGHDAY